MDERPGFWHNVVGHPLLVLCPPLGQWLHDRTRPTVPRWRSLIPHRVWIRATYVATGRPWVTTDQLDRPTSDKARRLWREGTEPGLLRRLVEVVPLFMPRRKATP